MPLKLGPGPWCGTPGGYTNHGCRCLPCTEAWRTYHRAYMHANPDRLRRQSDRERRRLRAKKVS